MSPWGYLKPSAELDSGGERVPVKISRNNLDGQRRLARSRLGKRPSGRRASVTAKGRQSRRKDGRGLDGKGELRIAGLGSLIDGGAGGQRLPPDGRACGRDGSQDVGHQHRGDRDAQGRLIATKAQRRRVGARARTRGLIGGVAIGSRVRWLRTGGQHGRGAHPVG